MPATVRYEQAVYGSFPFRDTGYAALASSPECQPEWLEAFHAACRGIGEKPANAGDLSGMVFCLPMSRKGPWMIVGVHSPGSDDRGRPGALAFHGLFVEASEFRKVGFDPFPLIGALRTDWQATTTLSTGSIEVVQAPFLPGARSIAIGSALSRGRKVAIASESPIPDLAAQVWRGLPVRLRKRCSVATWAFCNGPQFDLVAAPGLAGWNLEGPYRDPFGEEESSIVRRWRRVSWLQIGIFLVVVCFLGGLATWPLWPDSSVETDMPLPNSPTVEPLNGVVSYWSPSPPVRVIDPSVGPERSAYADAQDDEAELDTILSRLKTLAKDQLGIPIFVLADDGEGKDRIEVSINAIGNYRYTGPLLTDAELAEIGQSSAQGRSRALMWDRLIRMFVADRWPANFRNTEGIEPSVMRWRISTFGDIRDSLSRLRIEPGPLRWEIDTLSWSFHLTPDPRLTAIEAVEALSDALKVDEPVTPNPLEKKYPTLYEYAKFLSRLPVR